ncbi:MAG: leucine-rich repeat protein [Bacilli bacterium]|nr:leucine-rich repeat protein [Bacilli bacterium]
MAGLLTNGFYAFKVGEDPSTVYDVAAYDNQNNVIAGIKKNSGIYYYEFSGYRNIDKITFYNDNVLNGYGMFTYCQQNPALTAVPSEFKNMSAAARCFYQCIDLNHVQKNCFQNLKTDSNYMFANCVNLTSVDCTFSAMTDNFAYSFQYCTNITSLPDNMLNNCGSAAASYLGHTFEHCHRLTTLPKNSFNAVTGMYGTFYNCSGLQDISNITSCFANAKSAAAGSHAPFYNCKSVTSELIPVIDYFKTKSVPLSAGSAHIFSAMTAAADYTTVKNSPTYSGWV